MQATFTGAVGEYDFDLEQASPDGHGGNFITIQRVLMPASADSISIVCYGSASAAGSVWLYPYITWPNPAIDKSGILTGSGVEFTGGTTAGKTKLTIDLSSANPDYVNGMTLRARIGVFAESRLSGTDILGADETITSAGFDWVVTSAGTPGLSVGDFAYVKGNASQTARKVISVTDLGSTSEYYVARPWGLRPEKDDVLNGQALVEYIPQTVTAWAERKSVVG